MRLILLVSFFFFWAMLSSAQKWQDATVIKVDSTELKGQVKWRDEVSMTEFRYRDDKGKVWLEVDSVLLLQTADKAYHQIKLPQIEGKPVLLAEVLAPGLYHGVFKEVRCLCDNSFDMVEAYIVRDKSTYVLRKKAFIDAFKNDTEFPPNFSPEADMTFKGYPYFYRSKTGKAQ